MFGRATMTLGIGPHSSLSGISAHNSYAVYNWIIRSSNRLLAVYRMYDVCGIE